MSVCIDLPSGMLVQYFAWKAVILTTAAGNSKVGIFISWTSCSGHVPEGLSCLQSTSVLTSLGRFFRVKLYFLHVCSFRVLPAVLN